MKFGLTTKSGEPIKLNPAQLKSSLTFGAVVFVGVFCLFGSKTMLSKVLHEQHIISANHKALKQLNTNISAAATLSSQYNSLFENSNPSNVLGFANDSSPSAAPPNVDNARLALDALPVTYDYPALLASISKILTNHHISAPSITGTDQTTTVSSAPSLDPAPTKITITVAGSGTYNSVQGVLADFEHSIRPLDVTNLILSGSNGSLSFTATVNTYFQPAKLLGVSQGNVK